MAASVVVVRFGTFLTGGGVAQATVGGGAAGVAPLGEGRAVVAMAVVVLAVVVVVRLLEVKDGRASGVAVACTLVFFSVLMKLGVLTL